MSEKQNGSWVMFLVVGMFLNTLGIALPSLGWPRYLLMTCGLALLLMAVLRLQAGRSRR